MNAANEKLLTTGAAARMLGVSTSTVILWERRGLLTAVRTASGRRLFSCAEVQELVERRQRPTTIGD